MLQGIGGVVPPVGHSDGNSIRIAITKFAICSRKNNGHSIDVTRWRYAALGPMIPGYSRTGRDLNDLRERLGQIVV